MQVLQNSAIVSYFSYLDAKIHQCKWHPFQMLRFIYYMLVKQKCVWTLSLSFELLPIYVLTFCAISLRAFIFVNGKRLSGPWKFMVETSDTLNLHFIGSNKLIFAIYTHIRTHKIQRLSTHTLLLTAVVAHRCAPDENYTSVLSSIIKAIWLWSTKHGIDRRDQQYLATKSTINEWKSRNAYTLCNLKCMAHKCLLKISCLRG